MLPLIPHLTRTRTFASPVAVTVRWCTIWNHTVCAAFIRVTLPPAGTHSRSGGRSVTLRPSGLYGHARGSILCYESPGPHRVRNPAQPGSERSCRGASCRLVVRPGRGAIRSPVLEPPAGLADVGAGGVRWRRSCRAAAAHFRPADGLLLAAYRARRACWNGQRPPTLARGRRSTSPPTARPALGLPVLAQAVEVAAVAVAAAADRARSGRSPAVPKRQDHVCYYERAGTGGAPLMNRTDRAALALAIKLMREDPERRLRRSTACWPSLMDEPWEQRRPLRQLQLPCDALN